MPAHFQSLQIACYAPAGGFEPCFFQGPDPEKGVRVILLKQPFLFNAREPALNHLLPLWVPFAGFNVYAQCRAVLDTAGRQAVAMA
jgi:hypothetical protein